MSRADSLRCLPTILLELQPDNPYLDIYTEPINSPHHHPITRLAFRPGHKRAASDGFKAELQKRHQLTWNNEPHRRHQRAASEPFGADPFNKEEAERSSNEISTECGVGAWRPVWLQHCANIWLFLTMLCIISTLQGSLIGGYLNSVITTIEKRFDMASSHSGLIAASVELGSLASVIFVSYLGGRRHIPVWIGCGALLQSLGALVFCLPHVLSEAYSLSSLMVNGSAEDTCHPYVKDDGRSNPACIEGASPSNWLSVSILIAAQVMVGSGGSPLYTLGITYIDDHIRKEQAAPKIAYVYAAGALGPVLGFALGACMLQYYVDVSFDVGQLRPNDPRWVGAWWAGFIICGILLFFFAFPLFFFPRSLNTRSKTRSKNIFKDKLNTSSDYGKKVSDIPISMLRLLRNPVYLITCLGVSCEVTIVSGFIVFLPKYLETQFGMTKSQANLLTGGIAVPGAVLGILGGGTIMKRFKLSARGALQLTLALNVMALCGFSVLLFLGCPNVPLASLPSNNSSSFIPYGTNATAVCNQTCNCDQVLFSPICGANGLTYHSPCHAGCQVALHGNYSQCGCIDGFIDGAGSLDSSLPVLKAAMARAGACRSECHMLFPFMLLLFIMTFMVAGTQMPLLMVTIRSVQPEERAFALGMQFVLLRLFAYIPAPIIYGQAIDASCLIWKENICGDTGSCLLFDIVLFRYKYIGISGALKLAAAVFFIVDWCMLVHMPENERPQLTTMSTSTTGGTSLSLLSTTPDAMESLSIAVQPSKARNEESAL